MYPLAMALLIFTTAFSCGIVLINILITLFNFEDTPAEPFVLGIASFSKIGLIGVCIQTFLIGYVWCASIVGLYSLPILNRLRPIRHQTPFFKIMLNCLLILILSSALPIFFRTVGITNFDLFGSFGQIVWIRNYQLVLVYNCAFLVALIFCLCHSIVLKLSRKFLSHLHSLIICSNRSIQFFKEKVKKITNLASKSGQSGSQSSSSTSADTSSSQTPPQSCPSTTNFKSINNLSILIESIFDPLKKTSTYLIASLYPRTISKQSSAIKNRNWMIGIFRNIFPLRKLHL